MDNRDSQLLDALRTLPTPEATPDFVERVLGAAARSHQRRRAVIWGGGLSAAAAMLIGIGVALNVGEFVGPVPAQDKPAQDRVVYVAPEQAQTIRIVLRSPRAIPGVTIRVAFAGDVWPADGKGKRELAWQADLKPGANVVSLPVIARNQGGTLVATVTRGDARREYSMVVRPQRSGSTRGSGSTRAPAATPVASTEDLGSLFVKEIRHA